MSLTVVGLFALGLLLLTHTIRELAGLKLAETLNH